MILDRELYKKLSLLQEFSLGAKLTVKLYTKSFWGVDKKKIDKIHNNEKIKKEECSACGRILAVFHLNTQENILKKVKVAECLNCNTYQVAN